MTTRQCKCLWRFLIVAHGILFIVAGVYLYLNWIDMFTEMRGKKMALSPESPAFSGWKVSPLPLNFDVYLFNWTNPEDYYPGSTIKPHFEEIGPYRFREIPDKVDIEWHNENSSISFRKKATFYFDPENSRGSLDDRITSVDTVAHSSAMRERNETNLRKKMVEFTLGVYHKHISITRSAREWMFMGYSDPLVKMGKMLSVFTSDIVVPYDRIGWLYTRNDSSTYDGHFNMFTGADDIYKMGQIHSWNHMTHNGAFEGECGVVKGSMGEFFPPNLSTNDSVFIYLPNLCRAVPLDYTETVSIHGVTAYKFSGTERSVDNGTLYPEASCFCVNGKCEKSGVINISPCKFNSSIYMSYPHFYKADPSYLEAVEGLSPDKEKHEFFMTLEPNAGVPMDVGGGFQANYLLEPVPGFRKFENISRVFIPLMWAEERVRVTPEIAADIALVPLIVLFGQIVTGILLAGGVILICWYPTKCITNLRYNDDPKVTAALLNPLTNAPIIKATVTPLRKAADYTNVPLLQYRSRTAVTTSTTATAAATAAAAQPIQLNRSVSSSENTPSEPTHVIVR